MSDTTKAACRDDRAQREFGALLMITGMITGMLPPPPGPFDLLLILGGLSILTPGTRGPIDGWARRRFPKAHRCCQAFVDRLRADLERHYPEMGSRAAASESTRVA